jgi:ribonuclease HII
MATKNYKYVIGIDEAGRGPLAGPVAVGIVLVPVNFDWRNLSGVGDSKALSPKKRENVHEAALSLAREFGLVPAVVFKSAKEIDKKGIAVVIKEAIVEGIDEVTAKVGASPLECLVLLDGSLKAPSQYQNQKTIIKGDAKESVIGLASIFAKVTRDAYMVSLAHKKAFISYDFATHKGYGTKKHRETISRVGLSVEHRASFCRNCAPTFLRATNQHKS